jgi:hypothetical protein
MTFVDEMPCTVDQTWTRLGPPFDRISLVDENVPEQACSIASIASALGAREHRSRWGSVHTVVTSLAWALAAPVLGTLVECDLTVAPSLDSTFVTLTRDGEVHRVWVTAVGGALLLDGSVPVAAKANTYLTTWVADGLSSSLSALIDEVSRRTSQRSGRWSRVVGASVAAIVTDLEARRPEAWLLLADVAEQMPAPWREAVFVSPHLE